MTIAKNEFSNTFVKNNLSYNEGQAESKKSLAITNQEESKEGNPEEETVDSINKVSKQKIVLNKDGVKKKAKKLEVVQRQSTGTSHNINDSENSLVSDPKQKNNQKIQLVGNVEVPDGNRKEIAQINEIGSQPRSKYFPGQVQNSVQQ